MSLNLIKKNILPKRTKPHTYIDVLLWKIPIVWILFFLKSKSLIKLAIDSVCYRQTCTLLQKVFILQLPSMSWVKEQILHPKRTKWNINLRSTHQNTQRFAAHYYSHLWIIQSFHLFRKKCFLTKIFSTFNTLTTQWK